MHQRVHRHLFAVVDSSHITWYDVAATTGGSSGRRRDGQARRVEQVALLGSQFSTDSSGTRVVVTTRSGRTVEMDLGSFIVANTWLHVLARRGMTNGNVSSRYPAYNGEVHRWTMADGANVQAFNNIAGGYSSSGLVGDDDMSEFQFDPGSGSIEPAAAIAQAWMEGSRSGSGSQAALRLVPI
ncbi:hypothetical protein IWW38_004502 [Coemansia aciculifera]|uniref:Uncharacterized protein n=1 Tax=Coemansia aciculifera TaxID=417176 RepID=A0ACC1LYC9_9FUNG|nr:hypothetical protein IWW38_004502 [Coemansia aciculifera]